MGVNTISCKQLKGRRSLMIGSGNPTGGITTGVGLNI